MRDENGRGTKVLCVASTEPAGFLSATSIYIIPESRLEIQHFFEVY